MNYFFADIDPSGSIIDVIFSDKTGYRIYDTSEVKYIIKRVQQGSTRIGWGIIKATSKHRFKNSIVEKVTDEELIEYLEGLLFVMELKK